MIVKKNQQVDAAIAILGNKRRAIALLDALQSTPGQRFDFYTLNCKRLKYAVLAVENPGASATIIASPPTSNQEIIHIGQLIDQCVAHLIPRGIHLAQTVLSITETRHMNAFEQASFKKLAILTYMELSKQLTKKISIPNNVQFVTMRSKSDEYLGALLEETYVDSLDCPKIHGLRKIQDIISGHRGHVQHDAQLWFIAELEAKPFGVLLLNPVKRSNCMELAYIGIAPLARGQGLSHIIMQHAIDQSVKYGLPRITLAVDKENAPAIRLYKKWNFRTSQQRLAMIRKLC